MCMFCFICVGIGVTIDNIKGLKLSWFLELSQSLVDNIDLQHRVDHQDGCDDLSKCVEDNKKNVLESCVLRVWLCFHEFIMFR